MDRKLHPMTARMKYRPQGLRRQQAGISLLEALLAASIATAMLAALVVLLADSQAELRAKNMAEQMQAFQRVAAHYFVANRLDLLDAMGENANGEAHLHCQVDFDPEDGGGQPAFDPQRNTCAIDVSLLRARRLLPETFSERTPHGEKLIALFRRVYDDPDSENPLPTENVEMLVLSVLPDDMPYAADNRRFNESLSVSSYMGANGGVLPDGDRGKCRAVPQEGVYDICGNGWKLNLGDFLGDEQLQAFSDLLQP